MIYLPRFPFHAIAISFTYHGPSFLRGPVACKPDVESCNSVFWLYIFTISSFLDCKKLWVLNHKWMTEYTWVFLLLMWITSEWKYSHWNLAVLQCPQTWNLSHYCFAMQFQRDVQVFSNWRSVKVAGDFNWQIPRHQEIMSARGGCNFFDDLQTCQSLVCDLSAQTAWKRSKLKCRILLVCEPGKRKPYSDEAVFFRSCLACH